MQANPRARAIEDWLQSLAARAGSDDGPGERVLFVLDKDFGELSIVMYLVLGQPCFRNARILLSPRLHAANGDALPGRTALWETEEDLAAAIDQWKPRLVVLASGYVLPVHQLLSADAIERLQARAERAGAVLVTADPFLGLVSPWAGEGLHRLLSLDIPTDNNPALAAAKRAGDAMLHRALAGAEKALRQVPHLYPSFTDMEGVARYDSDARNLCFFNEALLVPPGILPDGPHKGSAPGDAQPFWMFLISQVDFEAQSLAEGPEQFPGIVADKLKEAVALGRRAVLLAPVELIEAVRPKLPPDDRIELLAFCPFARAMSLLLAAEHCFYWNLVSHSIIMLLWNGRSVILFDRGHLVRAVPAIRERVIAWYYQGWEPTFLAHRAPLSLSILGEAAVGEAERRAARLARYRRAPAPAAMLKSLLAPSPEPAR